jgi:hypothetical protein
MYQYPDSRYQSSVIPSLNPVFGDAYGFIPPSALHTGNRDVDSLPIIHRRKMLRRAANRKSAQLSRARKKVNFFDGCICSLFDLWFRQAHMEDMKSENTRLQRLVDILESQPELLFSINKEGKITYITDKSISSFKEISSDPSDEDPVHISQLFTAESVSIILDAISHLKIGDNIFADSSASVKVV